MAKFGVNATDKEQKRFGRQQKKAERQAKLRERHATSKARQATFDKGIGIVGLVGLLLLMFGLISYLSGKPPVTFQGFLEFLQTCPAIDITEVLSIPQIATANWGIFQVIGSFINGIITIINALMFIVTCIVNAVSIILWFLQYLFL